jgi:hypothetical protein
LLVIVSTERGAEDKVGCGPCHEDRRGVQTGAGIKATNNRKLQQQQQHSLPLSWHHTDAVAQHMHVSTLPPLQETLQQQLQDLQERSSRELQEVQQQAQALHLKVQEQELEIYNTTYALHGAQVRINRRTRVAACTHLQQLELQLD